MKRITFEVDDLFAKKFSHYCIENNTSKKSAIINLLIEKMENRGMEQFFNLNESVKGHIDFMNEENYKRLSKLKIDDKESWDMRHNLPVNRNINDYFERDETLISMIYFLNESKNKEVSIPRQLLDHDYYMRFNKKDIDYYFEPLYGIMTFPYISFNGLEELISSWSTKFWNLFIINPALMNYADGNALGLFITPLKPDLITEINGFFETLTGYKLFYLWTNDEEIKPILRNKNSLDISIWFDRLTNDEFPQMYKKIIKFWFDNEEIKCYSLKNSYFQFTHKMPYNIPFLDGITLEGPDFEMKDTITGWTSGNCNKIEFDLKAFHCIYVDGREVLFTEEMLENFKNGEFELKRIYSR